MNVEEIGRLLAEKEREAAQEWPKANEGQVPVALSVGKAGPYEVGWVTKPEALPGLLQALAEELDGGQPGTLSVPTAVPTAVVTIADGASRQTNKDKHGWVMSQRSVPAWLRAMADVYERELADQGERFVLSRETLQRLGRSVRPPGLDQS